MRKIQEKEAQFYQTLYKTVQNSEAKIPMDVKNMIVLDYLEPEEQANLEFSKWPKIAWELAMLALAVLVGVLTIHLTGDVIQHVLKHRK